MTRIDESQADDSGIVGGAGAGQTPGGFTQIGRYKVIRELGRGAMGVVYEAVDPKIGRKVALKVLHNVPGISEPELEEFRSRFYREARTAGMLAHPNIVVVHDVDSDEKLGISFMAMECLKGQTIYDLLRSGVKFTTEQTIDICIQVAEGLDHAHRQGVVHRDVKPANLMLLEDGTLKITDFGIAKISTSNLTRTGQFLGTPNYMSPEQVIGHVIDGRSDLFSLGIILYELLTGEKPFMGSSLTTITYQIVNVDPIEPSKIRPGLPKRYDAIVAKLLKKGPDERFQTGKDVAEALRAVRDGADAQAGSAVGASQASLGSTEATHVSAGIQAPAPPTLGSGMFAGTAVGAAVGGPGTMAGGPQEARPSGGPSRAVYIGSIAALVVIGALVAMLAHKSSSEPKGASVATGASTSVVTGGVATAPAGASAVTAATSPMGATPAPQATAPAAASAPRVATASAPRPAASAPRAATFVLPPPLTTSHAVTFPTATGTPPASAQRMAAGSATVTLVLQHKLKDGTVTVTVDNKQVLSLPVNSSKRGKDSVSQDFKVPDGRHDVRVCVSSPDLAQPLCNTKQFSFVMNRTATIRATEGKMMMAPAYFSMTIE